MVECNEASNIYLNLNDQQQFRLPKINEVRDFFIAEIRERQLISKGLSKYIASFDYFDKYLIVLSETSGSISIASYVTIIGAPAAIAIASFNLTFSMSTGIIIEIAKSNTK